MTVTELPVAVPPEQEEGHSSIEVCAIAGITYRQCDYWDRADVVKPSIRPARRTGSRRRCSDTDVLHVCVVATMLNAGVSLSAVREHLDAVLDTGTVETAGVTIRVDVAGLRARVDGWRRAG